MFGLKLKYLFCNLSIVHNSFKHGKNFKMGYFNVIKENVIVGNGVDIQHYVLLKENTKIGNNVYVDSYFRSSGNNIIGNNITLRFGSTIARNVVVDDGTFISPNVMTIYSKHTGERSQGIYIGKNTFIGTSAVIGPNVTIGDGMVIGAKAYVSENCIEKGIYIGIPAKLKSFYKGEPE